MDRTLVAFLLLLVAPSIAAQEIAWEANGRDVYGTRYSPAAVITRGVSMWTDDQAPPGTPCRTTIFIATAQAELIALDAVGGQPCRDFGSNGRVDLKSGLRIEPFEPAAYTVTSPPVIVNGLVITGSSVADNTQPDLPSGEVDSGPLLTRPLPPTPTAFAGGLRYMRLWRTSANGWTLSESQCRTAVNLSGGSQ